MTTIKNAPGKEGNKIEETRHEDNKFKVQFDIIYKGFFEQPQTMKMLSMRTNIDRANICRYCRELRKSKNIAIFKKAICPITKHPANYWTTNPDLFPISSQLKMF